MKVKQVRKMDAEEGIKILENNDYEEMFLHGHTHNYVDPQESFVFRDEQTNEYVGHIRRKLEHQDFFTIYAPSELPKEVFEEMTEYLEKIINEDKETKIIVSDYHRNLKKVLEDKGFEKVKELDHDIDLIQHVMVRDY